MSVEAGRHTLRELGFTTRRAGHEMHGMAPVTPEMHVPGTAALRTSILATWADNLAGLLAVDAMPPRVPVTLELDVHLRYLQAVRAGPVVASARVHHGLAQVELRDSGRGDRLSVTATARTFGGGWSAT